MNTIAFVTGAFLIGLIAPVTLKSIKADILGISKWQSLLCAIGCALLAYGTRG